RSCLLAPIQSRRHMHGVFALGSLNAGAFQEGDIEPATAAAQILGVMMSHQVLVEDLKATSSRRAIEIEEAIKNTETLLEVSRILLGPDRGHALERVSACMAGRSALEQRVADLMALWRENHAGAELQRVNEELARTLGDLQSSRAQLQKAEKLASVG